MRPLVRLAKAPRRVGGITGGFSKVWAFALALSLAGMNPAVAGTTPGTVISNTATLTYVAPDSSTQTLHTNTVSTTVVSATRTPSSVIFMDYTPASSLATTSTKGGGRTTGTSSSIISKLLVGPTECSTDGGATFNTLANPVQSGTTLDVSKAQPLMATTIYNLNDVLFIRLTDQDQNVDPAVRDSVVVTVSVPSTHQSVVLQLTETGVDTGVFAGYVPTSATSSGGCVLQAAAKSQVQVNYVDSADSSDTSVADALVDPYNVVFDSTSGKRLDGAKLTLVDATTGKPVRVLGKDGVSTYPSTVVSGSTVTDSEGVKYKAPKGGFLFPYVKPGDYRLEVEPPSGYHAPSLVKVNALEKLFGSPYTLPSGSFGKVITHRKSGIVQLDVPVDPVSGQLLMQKSVSSATASIGDVVEFTLMVQNTSSTLAAEGVSIADLMPQGFRYMKGSARIGNNQVLPDPAISANGQQLTFAIGHIDKSGTVSVTYAVEITASTPLTTVVNTAYALEGGRTVSNQATASVQVQSDFLQNVNTLVGRVVVGCDSQGKQGVEKARVVMEDGSYAVTDKDGEYHFQAVTNGTHVVQLDLASLPKGYEPMTCERNTRWAGRNYSQFVEVHGGALWRADFHVRPIPGAEGDLSLQLTQDPLADHVHNTVQLTDADVPASDLSATVLMPAGMTYMKGSARLDGHPLADPQDAGDGMLVFRLGDRETGWKGVLEFDTRLPAPHKAPDAQAHQKRTFTIEGFPSGQVELGAHDREAMQQIADLVKGSTDITMTFVGYTDDVQLATGSKYANNIELSIARAQAVADYVQSHIDTDSAQVFISGRGANDPLASNATEAGRAENRRTEIQVQYDTKQPEAVPATADSMFQTRVLANFDSPAAKSQHTAPAVVTLRTTSDAQPMKQEFALEDFAPGSSSLSGHDQAVMDQIAALIKGSRDVRITFVGSADTQHVAAGSEYANNMELSIARAQAAADYARSHMDMDGAQVFIVGRGDSDGDADGRRTMIDVSYDALPPASADAGGQSGVQHAVVKGLSPADEADAKDQAAKDAADDVDPSKQDLADKFQVDAKWLETQNGDLQFVWPTEAYLPASPAIHVAVEHAPKQVAVLSVNGEPVSGVNYLSDQKNTQGTAAVTEWIGVPLKEGDNVLTAQIKEGDKVVATLERKVHYSGVPVRAEFVADKSSLVADGRTKPVFAMRLFDKWGYPARPGLMGHYQVNAPFTDYQSVAQLQQNQTSALAPRGPSYVIGEGGIAYLRLAPTTDTGEITVSVPVGQDLIEQVHAWMRPAERDWILVGVASGTAAFDKIKNNMQSLQGDDPNSDIYQDGRVAFYAKGTIGAGYLLTTSYDSAKAGGVLSNGLQQAVNPNTYFMLYGDASQQGFDASSSQKLYVKIERDQFYAMFGDYDTGLTVTELSHYDRMFTGLKSGYQGEHLGYTAFAAQNNQAFVKDEIQGNGTSGLYHLSHQQILINSERVSIEVRDRYTNAVLSTQQFTPFVDYTLDYFGGTLYFKQPVPPRDDKFNPEYIVVEYEVSTGASNVITGGGRASVKTADGKVEVGVTGVSEGTGDGNNKLAGADLRVQVSPSTVLKAEVAHTDNGPNGSSSTVSGLSTVSTVPGVTVTNGATNSNDATGNAYSLDLKTQSATLQNDVYLKNEGATFGLGQQSLGDVGMYRLGDDTKYNLTKNWSLVAGASRQESLVVDTTSDVANGGFLYKSDAGDSVGFGLQHAQDSFPNATPTLQGGTAQGNYATDQAMVNGSYSVTKKVTLHGNVMQSVSGQAADPQYPNQVSAGVDYKVTKKTTLFVDEQDSSGAQFSDRTTTFGAKSEPWSHGEVDSSVSNENTEYGPRLFSTLGLTQGWDVTKDLSLQAGYNRVASMHQPDYPATTQDQATAPAVGTLTQTQDFNALFVGFGYHQESWSMNGRFETLNSSDSTTRNLFAGFYRALSQGQAFSASFQGFHSMYQPGGASDSVDGRLGYAYRPYDSRWSWLEQLDLIYANQQGLQGMPQFATSTGVAASQESAATLANNPQTVAEYGINMRNWKIVNNLQQNYTLDSRYQFSLYYGSKWARFTFDTGSYAGYTDLIGGEFRYDLTPKWDTGFLASREHSYSAGVVKYSYGIETGWDIATNMWLSLGYNFSGFYDQDFTANHYTAKGIFLRFRFKFDQDTVKQMAAPSKVGLPPVP